MNLKKMVMVGIVTSSLIFGGCATTSGGGTTPSEIISTIQGVETSIQWIEPIAGGVVTIFVPAALPLYTLACTAANAGITVANDAIAAYTANPTTANLTTLQSSLTDLNNFWIALQNAYQNKSVVTSLTSVVTASVQKRYISKIQYDKIKR